MGAHCLALKERRNMSSVDLEKYCQVMEEVKRRTNVVRHFLGQPHHALYQAAAVEAACLQVRKILELVALGSLVANQDIWNGSLRHLRNAWNANDILKRLREVNPDFYPQPVSEVPMTGPVKSDIKDLTEGFLTEGMFGELYGKLGEVLHAKNPLGPPMDYDHWLKATPQWMNLIIKLLNSHKIKLLDNPNMFLIHMNDQSDGNVRGYVFERLGPSSDYESLIRDVSG